MTSIGHVEQTDIRVKNRPEPLLQAILSIEPCLYECNIQACDLYLRFKMTVQSFNLKFAKKDHPWKNSKDL